MNAVTEQRKVLLEIADLKVHFDIKDGKQWFWQPAKTLKAVDGVTLRLYEGETLGVVGESGCGKSTFARAIIGLVKATDGKVAWLGKDLLGMKQEEFPPNAIAVTCFYIKGIFPGWQMRINDFITFNIIPILVKSLHPVSIFISFRKDIIQRGILDEYGGILIG